MNGAQALIRTLVDAGVDVCFANPGTSEMHFVAALDDVPDMRAVLTLFEGVATGAADGYARMAGTPGRDAAAPRARASATGWPTCTTPAAARAPMVNVVGDHARAHKRLDAPLESDIDALAGSVSGWVRRSLTPAEVAADAADAVAAASAAPGHDRHADPAGRRVVGGRRGGRPAARLAGGVAGGAVGARRRRRRAHLGRGDGALHRRRRDDRRRAARRGPGGRRHGRPAAVGDVPGAGDAWGRAARRPEAALSAGDGDRRPGRHQAPRARRCARRRCTSSAIPATCRATRCRRTARCTCSRSRGRTASPRCRPWPRRSPRRRRAEAARGVAPGAAERSADPAAGLGRGRRAAAGERDPGRRGDHLRRGPGRADVGGAAARLALASPGARSATACPWRWARQWPARTGR